MPRAQPQNCPQHHKEMVRLVIGSGSKTNMLDHLSEGDKSDDMKVNFAKHWEAVIDIKATKANFHCSLQKMEYVCDILKPGGIFGGYPQTKCDICSTWAFGLFVARAEKQTILR